MNLAIYQQVCFSVASHTNYIKIINHKLLCTYILIKRSYTNQWLQYLQLHRLLLSLLQKMYLHNICTSNVTWNKHKAAKICYYALLPRCRNIIHYKSWNGMTIYMQTCKTFPTRKHHHQKGLGGNNYPINAKVKV